ncbi:MAG TPA: methyl-accepting chemotaxis protein, partial [Lachnospiraceae bacterium]|nr:methyl-accepting chemotaxis protein [Lachnospiraceae bacterium]
MKNLKIRNKLLVTFMIIIILFCGSVYTAVTGLQENEEKYSEFYNVGYQITNKVMNMRRGLQIIIKDLTFITLDGGQSKSSTYSEDLEKEVQ